MSTHTFLAWSLLTTGILAALAFAARRRAVARHGALPPLTGVQSAIMAAMVFLLGAQVTAIATAITSATGFETPISPLSMPIGGALVALLGVNGLYTLHKDGETFRWQRQLSIFNLAAGTLLLVLGIVRP